MPRKIRRTIRRGQTLSPFGVGAIYDVLGESFVAADTTRWPGVSEIITMERLAASIPGADDFRCPPPAPDEKYKTHGPGMPFQRFPRWLFCPQCRRMQRWNNNAERDLEGGAPRCGSCPRGPALVPMRFVAICSEGHLDDVDWSRWAHSGSRTPGSCRDRALEFRSSTSRGSGLASLSVRCRTCGAERDLGGIAVKDSMARVGVSCRGLQPWLHPDRRVECGKVPQVVQRGASNVHFAEIRSAIDIPPWSDYDPDVDELEDLRTDAQFAALEQALADGRSDDDPLVVVLATTLADKYGVEAAAVIQVARKRSTGKTTPAVPVDEDDLVEQEWQAFNQPPREPHHRDRFVIRRERLVEESEGAGAALAPFVDRVVVADKLREVRAFVGFSRLDPGGTVVTPDLGRGLPWLPALEIYGEGVFLALDGDRLAEWESRPEVRERVAMLEANRVDSHLSNVLRDPATPRFVAIHTLAHLLIRQLTFECGYSSASLRERLYARGAGDGAMAGLLVYTASGDSEGTLGGLARQGEPPRLGKTMLAALSRATWCSTDPICIESTGQGLGALNRGACHSCALVAETSCVHMNSLLDRALVIGTPDEPGLGLFAEVVEHVSLGVA